MQNKITSRLALLGTLLLVPVAATHAAAANGLYVGAAWGAYTVDESSLDDNDDMLKGFVGIQINEMFGIEGQWNDFNRLSNGNNDRFEADGWGLSAMLSFPVGKESTIFAKIGNFWWDSESSFAGSARDTDGNDPFWGAGFKFGFNKHLALRIEWERYDVSSIDLDTYSVGLQFNF